VFLIFLRIFFGGGDARRRQFFKSQEPSAKRISSTRADESAGRGGEDSWCIFFEKNWAACLTGAIHAKGFRHDGGKP
jgi:hypothetical protein